MRAERRKCQRQEVSMLEISSMSSLKNLNHIAKGGKIVDASITGLLIVLKREDLIPKNLRQNLTLDSIIGDHVQIHLEQFDLEITGIIARTRLLGKKGYEIAIDYSEDAPKYWRECLLELIPKPGEFE